MSPEFNTYVMIFERWGSETRYNSPLLIKEARSRSVAELDHLVNQEVQRVIEGHFFSRGYVFEK